VHVTLSACEQVPRVYVPHVVVAVVIPPVVHVYVQMIDSVCLCA